MKFIIVLLFIVTTTKISFVYTQNIMSTPNCAIKRVSEIVKSPSDKQQYRGLVLENKMQVLLVSDPEIEKASAALTVGVGSQLDPVEFQGVAHFLEHMLFMGSKKYPDMEKYRSVIGDNGGYCNAWTSRTETNYHFQTTRTSFYETLDIFAQFFVSPLLTDDATDKEMNAVNSEAEKNLNTDFWRTYHLINCLSNEDSQLNRYTIGNLNTLKKDGIREALMGFHDKYYSADIMGQAMYSNDSLDNMEKAVMESFSEVVNKNIAPISFKNHPYPYSQEKLGKLIKSVPVKDHDYLQFKYLLPELEKEKLKKPLNYISHLIGHESKNSLLAFLIEEGLALSLDCGGYSEEDYFSNLDFNIKLTKKGFQEWQKVLSIVGAYQKMIKEKGVQEWIHNECRDLLNIQFLYQNKGSPINKCVSSSNILLNHGITNVLNASYIMDPFDKDLLQSLVDKLVPENLLQNFVSKSFVGELDKTLPIYGMEYSVRDLTQEEKDLLNKPDVSFSKNFTVANIDLPEPNPFIAKNFDIFYKGTPTDQSIKMDVPELIRQDNKVSFYFLQDKEFLLPKVQMNIMIHVDIQSSYYDPEIGVMSSLWVKELKDYLRDLNYQAELADLKFEISKFSSGVEIQIRCYNDSLSKFINWFLEQLKVFKDHYDQEKFELFYDETKLNQSNTLKSQPYQLGMDKWQESMQDRHFDVFTMIEASNHITWDKYVHFKKYFMSNIRLEVSIDGNIEKSEGQNLVDNVLTNLEAIYNPRWMLADEINQYRIVKLNDNQTWIIEDVLTTADEKNSAYIGYYEVGAGGHLKPGLSWLENFMKEKYFDELRTKQQLGIFF